jgi:hypothetical protein
MQLVRQERRISPDVLRIKFSRGERSGFCVNNRQIENALQDVPRLVLVLVEMH